MTAIQMNAELLRQISYIAEDETLVAKVLKYIKHLVETSVPVESQHGEVVKGINEMCKQIKAAEAGSLKGRPIESLFDEL